MKTITFDKRINRKWLTQELQAANVRVSTVAQNEGETVGYAEIEEADEALAILVIEAHDPDNTPDIHERADLATLYNKIENELAWIETARTDITNGIAVIDGGATLTQLRGVVRGLALIVDRVLVEQREELKSWKYVTRRLK